jgi:hypothetical protein
MSTQFTNRQWRLPNNENKDKQSNYSMDFDGSSYIDCGDSDTFSFGNGTTDSPFSVSFWTKLNSVTGTQPFLSKDAASPNREWAISIFSDSSNGVRIFLKNQGGNNQQSIDSSTALTTGVWYHITTTYDGRGGSNAADGLSIYINGILDTPTNIAKATYTAMSNTTAPVYIGKYSTNEINGQIDAVAIFNYELSSSQVTTLYGSSSTGIGNPMSLSPKPVAYYPLGDQDAFNGANYLVPNNSLKDYVFDFIPNDYIDCGTGLGNSLGTYTGDLTFSIWFNTDTVNPANDGIFYIGDFNSQGALQVNIYNNNIIFRANGGAGSKQFSFTDTTSWHNLTCVYLTGDRANSKIYLDGILQTTSDSGSFPSSLSLSGLKTIIGSYQQQVLTL